MSTGDAEHIIDDAIQTFERIPREPDLSAFKQTHLEAVYEAARAIERDQDHRKGLRNLRRIEPLLERLRLLGKAIDIICRGALCVNHIWAPIKYFLQIAVEYDEGFKELVTAYSQIAKHLPRSAELPHSCEENDDIQVAVANICSDVLEFHGQIYLFLRRGGWKQLFNGSWKSFRSHLDNILDRLKQSRDLVEREVAYCNRQTRQPQQSSPGDTSNILASHSPTSLEDAPVKHYVSSHISGGTALLGDNLGTIHVHQHSDFRKASYCRRELIARLKKDERERYDQQLRESIAWLELDGLDREQETVFLQRAESREARTCEWIKHHPRFQSWLGRTDERPFLWLRGKPGSGKTTLATFVEQEVDVDPNSLLLYCLCSPALDHDGGDPCSLALRILITQILHKRPILVSYIYEEYFMKAKQPARYIPQILRTLLNSLDLSYIIVDGVDEWSFKSQTRFLKILDAILLRRRDEDPERPKVKLLLCSQDTKATIHRMRKEPTISLSDEHEKISRDIRTYTQSTLAGLYERFERHDVDEIATEVVRKANGMFLWVRLVVDTLLEQQSIYDLQRTLHDLPSELTGVYVHILKRLEAHRDERQKAHIRGIFTWVAFARRPLKTWEICDALVLGNGVQGLSRQTVLNKEILDLCKPLIEEHRDNTVTFVHFSVQRFLLSPEASGPYLCKELALLQVGATCFRYLMTCGDLFSGVKTLSTYTQITLGFHNLFPYVKEHGRAHLIDCGLTDIINKKSDDVESHVRVFLHQSLNCGSVWLRTLTDDSDIDGLASQRELCWQEPPRHISLPILHYLLTTSNDELPHDQSSETSGVLVEQNLTPIEKAYACYQEQFESLLQGNGPTVEQMGITQHDMEKFCSRYAAGSYLCRWLKCPRSTQGFTAPTERAKHERSHMQPFRCPKPTCEFAEVGLTSLAALCRHVQKYHEVVQEIPIPRLILSKHKAKNFDRGIENFVGNQSIQQRPEQQGVRLSTARELTKEDNTWINNRAAEMAKATPREQMSKIVESMDSRVRQSLQEKKIDPILYHIRMKALKEYRMQQAQRSSVPPMMNMNMPRIQSPFPNPGMPTTQPNNNNNNPFMGGVGYVQQQQNGIRQQQEGQLIVPASTQGQNLAIPREMIDNKRRQWITQFKQNNTGASNQDLISYANQQTKQHIKQLQLQRSMNAQNPMAQNIIQGQSMMNPQNRLNMLNQPFNQGPSNESPAQNVTRPQSRPQGQIMPTGPHLQNAPTAQQISQQFNQLPPQLQTLLRNRPSPEWPQLFVAFKARMMQQKQAQLQAQQQMNGTNQMQRSASQQAWNTQPMPQMPTGGPTGPLQMQPPLSTGAEQGSNISTITQAQLQQQQSININAQSRHPINMSDDNQNAVASQAQNNAKTAPQQRNNKRQPQQGKSQVQAQTQNQQQNAVKQRESKGVERLNQDDVPVAPPQQTNKMPTKEQFDQRWHELELNLNTQSVQFSDLEPRRRSIYGSLFMVQVQNK